MASYTPPEADSDDEDEAPSKKKKKATKKKKDPNAPKRPSSPYIFFCNSKRAEVKESLPEDGRGGPAVMTALGAAWGEATDKDKAPFLKEAAADKVRYEKDMESYTPPEADSDDEEAAKPKKKAKKTKA